jgi:hypothetical protein
MGRIRVWKRRGAARRVGDPGPGKRPRGARSFGEISHFDVFAGDVTEMKRLEGELNLAQKMQAAGQRA